jgi:hypothetical protein
MHNSSNRNQGKKTLVLGILNVTPASFSNGGLYFDNVAKAVAQVEHSHFSLIERLAFEVATLCLQHPFTLKVKVVLEKMGALEKAESAGIELVLEK